MDGLLVAVEDVSRGARSLSPLASLQMSHLPVTSALTASGFTYTLQMIPGEIVEATNSCSRREKISEYKAMNDSERKVEGTR